MREMVESIHIILQVINKLNLHNKLKNVKNSMFNYLNYVSSFKIKALKKNIQLS
jgi:NADH:ubiquinone oxidoreductase subunit D